MQFVKLGFGNVQEVAPSLNPAQYITPSIITTTSND